MQIGSMLADYFSMALAPELEAEGRRKSELQAWRGRERGRGRLGMHGRESRGAVVK